MKIKNLLLVGLIGLLSNGSLLSMMSNSTNVPLVVSSNCPRFDGQELWLMPKSAQSYQDVVDSGGRRLAEMLDAAQAMKMALKKYADSLQQAFFQPQILNDAHKEISDIYLALQAKHKFFEQPMPTDVSSCDIFIKTEDNSKSTVVTIDPRTLHYIKKDDHGLSPVSGGGINFGVVFE